MSDSVHADQLETVTSQTYELAEGPLWISETGELVWVDILSGDLHRCRPGHTPPSGMNLPATLGAVAPAASGTAFIAATGDGFSRILPDGKMVSVNNLLADEPDQRMNDGRCDPWGRFVAGTTSLSGKLGTSRLFRLEEDGTTTTLLSSLGISNGLCWSHDGETFHHIDTPSATVTSRPYSPDQSLAEGPARVLELQGLSGLPDGMTIDTDGNLWIAFWGGGCVRCLSPQGTLLHEIPLPVAQPTSCVFGGDDLATLFITTAWHGLGKHAKSELDGAIFSCRPGAKGLPQQPWKGCPAYPTEGES